MVIDELHIKLQAITSEDVLAEKICNILNYAKYLECNNWQPMKPYPSEVSLPGARIRPFVCASSGKTYTASNFLCGHYLDKRAALAIVKSFEDENQEQYK